MPADLIDFGIERSRHERFFGREDVLAAVDRHLDVTGAASRWVLVTGGPGMGKSAILSRWLDLEEQRGHRAPHHFLRRDVMDWDRPEAVARSLSAQIEALYPAQKDPEARPESRLIELLSCSSERSLDRRPLAVWLRVRMKGTTSSERRAKSRFWRRQICSQRARRTGRARERAAEAMGAAYVTNASAAKTHSAIALKPISAVNGTKRRQARRLAT
ncbi:hypothetical protein BE04_38375 [Sorangium cellulosum]|uniref:Orc1-like AAA ATPase domain-containing protein n=2 Tax=Sorangium cellulosum TaxID=56 RepID=A0A150PKR2_SORCE|nr:ATP-binding protein [Sorangium cellulosum]AGP36920.1 hypothetical protein SCE1572_21940 [Sorangium cellulosum So0157-2]KYF56018.1 hypothetical protein BE04_38375 [Sorangium cellulosum]